jgi:hypothetical protein
MAREGGSSHKRWQNTDELKFSFMFLSFSPEEFFSKILALGIKMQQMFLRPIFLIGDFSISSDHHSEAAGSENQTADLRFQASVDDAASSIHSGPDEFLFILGHARRNGRGDVNHRVNANQGGFPTLFLQQIGLSQFKSFLGMREFE